MTKVLRYNYPGTDTYDIATCTDGKWHVSVQGKDRVLEYDCELHEDECGQYLEFCGGSILPLTDKNGKLLSRWSEVSDNVNDNSLTPNPNTVESGDSLPSVGPQPHSVATLKTPFAPGRGENGNFFNVNVNVNDNENQNDNFQLSTFNFQLNKDPQPSALSPQPSITLNSKIEEVVTIREGAGRRKRTRRSKSQKGLEDNNSSLFTLHSSFDEDNLLFNSENTEPEAGKDRNILKAVGGMAAMTLTLVVIWETGLLIPFGILGLITAGILK